VNLEQQTARKISPTHIPQLDGIRAIAVSIVVAAHMGGREIIPGGFGVTLFFFLSGYLITSLMRMEYMNTGTISVRGFYMRRLFRIMPPLYISMAFVGALIGINMLQHESTPAGIWLQVLFLSNYKNLFGLGDGLPIPLWSLAIEEHFYLIFPFFYMLFLSKKSPAKAAQWCFAICAISLAFRFLTYSISPESMELNYKMSHTRLDSIMFGCSLALWNNPLIDRNAWRPNLKYFAVALALCIFTFVYRDDLFRQTLRYTFQGISLFVIFAYVLRANKWTDLLLCNALTKWVGLLSYSVYLIHVAIIGVIDFKVPDASPILRCTLILALTFGYAYLMHVIVERPLGNLRKKRPAYPRQSVSAS
jgi:peptidoglycan/LPS O-acetylase OafA/YrhL